MSTPLLLAVPDGAADPLGPGPTCLEQARTPALDRLAGRGQLQRVRTIPPGLPAGTEVGLAGLLGLALDAPPSRGRLEAAAVGITLTASECAWRLDVVPPRPAEPALVARANEALAWLDARVHPLRGHRMLLVGPAGWGEGPPGPHQTRRCLQEVATGPFAAVVAALRATLAERADVEALWPWGSASWPAAPQQHRALTLVTTGGAAAGLGALLDASVVVTRNAPVEAAAAALRRQDGGVVVVHVDGPDEAGHARDRDAKVAAIEAFDARVVAPLERLAVEHDATLVVAPDHGCDPANGRHSAEPVPAVRTAPRTRAAHVAGRRYSEHHVAGLPIVPAHQLLAEAAASVGAEVGA